MKSRRIVALGAGVATAALLLAGCSASGTESQDGPEPVVMWGSWSGDQVAQLEKQADAFNKSQDEYEVSYVAQELVEEKLLTSLAGGQVPDLVMWDRFQTSLYAPKGALQPIDDFVKKDAVDLDVFYEPALSEMKVDDKLYGLPLLVDDRSLYYNKTMFAEAGLQPPTNWDELKADAEALTVRDGGKLSRAGFLLDDPGLFSVYLAQAGGELVNSDSTKTAFNSAQGEQVLDYWKSLLDAGVYEQGFGDGSDAFAEGKAAMKLDGPWALDTLSKVDGLDYGVVEPPTGPNGDTGAAMGGFGLVIPEGAKNAEGAWAFAKWWTTEAKNSVDFAKISGWLPANRDAANDPYFTEDENYKAFVAALDYAQVRPNVEGFADVEGKALIPELEKFLSGEQNAKQALANAQKQGDQILEQNR